MSSDTLSITMPARLNLSRTRASSPSTESSTSPTSKLTPPAAIQPTPPCQTRPHATRPSSAATTVTWLGVISVFATSRVILSESARQR